MKMLLFTLLLFLSSIVYSQSYYVISIKGSVSVKGIPLKPKDKLDQEAQLVFGSEQDELKIMSPQKGYYLLKPDGAKQNSDKEFLIALKEALIPSKHYLATSSRGDAVRRCEYQFRNYLSLKTFFRKDVLILDTSFYTINEEEFPQDSLRYFALEQIIAEDTLLTPLPFEGQKMLLPASYIKLDSINTNPLTLLYLDELENSRTSIGTFNGRLVDREAIVEELKVIYEIDPMPPSDFLCKKAIPYLRIYGMPNPEQVKALLIRDLKIDF